MLAQQLYKTMSSTSNRNPPADLLSPGNRLISGQGGSIYFLLSYVRNECMKSILKYIGRTL